jgi:hypothetical protein
MKAPLACFGAFVAVAVATSAVAAQTYYPSQPIYPARVAPDLCGSYFYSTNGYTWYGPSYNVYPPFPPVGGVPPNIPYGTPYNPYTRSPRDFFMWTEAQQQKHTRETRPPFIP